MMDYGWRRGERRRTAGGQWLTAVVVERRGDGWMPVEIGARETIYARATGQPEVERVEFTSARKPGRLMLDPRARAHEYGILNHRERRAGVGRGAWDVRIDDPTRETARRDRVVRAWMPVAWYNDAGGVTLGLRERSNYLGAYNRGLLFGTVATRPAATARFGGYLRFADPIGHLTPRTQTSVAAWAIEGRAGAAFSIDRSLRRHLASRADPHVGFDALWMATTNLTRSEEHTSELQSRPHLVCRLLLEKKKKKTRPHTRTNHDAQIRSPNKHNAHYADYHSNWNKS